MSEETHNAVRNPGELTVDELKSMYTEAQMSLRSAELRMQEMGRVIVELNERLSHHDHTPDGEHVENFHPEVVEAHEHHEHELAKTF